MKFPWNKPHFAYKHKSALYSQFQHKLTLHNTDNSNTVFVQQNFIEQEFECEEHCRRFPISIFVAALLKPRPHFAAAGLAKCTQLYKPMVSGFLDIPQRSKALYSGFIIDHVGFILTWWHLGRQLEISWLVEEMSSAFSAARPYFQF